MRANKLLHKIIGTTMHKTRLSCLATVVESALLSKSLSVTAVGRKIHNQAQSRSNVRKVDRLYSNQHLFRSKTAVYQALTQFVVTPSKPTILVDGTKILNTDFYVLRASLAASGRALTLYEEIYLHEEYGSPKLYSRFLDGLESILPKDCAPILVTDAEFRGPWFDLVYEKQWDFVGRLRSTRKCRLGDDDCFYEVDSSKVKAGSTPRYIGPGLINVNNTVAGNFYSYLKPYKGRHAYTRTGRRSETDKSKKQTRSAREPWFLFSSMKKCSKKIIKIYELRMTIEENFRDMKSERFGLSMNMTKTKSKIRCQIMLIIAALATTIAYLIGCTAEQMQIHRKFQVSSTRKHRVLSRFFLGCAVLYRKIPIYLKQIRSAVNLIHAETEIPL